MHVTNKCISDSNLYTLLEVVKPQIAEERHMFYIQWMVVNIPGNNISNGITVRTYYPYTPPASTNHTYLYLVFDQIELLDVNSIDETAVKCTPRSMSAR